MTDKIYEYRDAENWFLGEWGGFNTISGLGNISNDALSELSLKVAKLNTSKCYGNCHGDCHSDDRNGYNVTVVKKSSDFQLIRFVADIINQETNRKLEVTQRAGAVIVTEAEQLLLVHLPENGVEASAFFGQTSETAFRKMFEKIGIKVENLNDYPDLPEVEETGMTFEENARLKAETISKLTGKMVLADDSGLKVDALGGLPGVWSARFSGPDATDESNNAKLLHELAMVFDHKERSAQFHTTLVVAAPDKDSLVVEADWPGYIAMEAKGDNGFGYDPLFMVGETGRHAAELTAEEKNDISHRGLAVKKLMEAFPVWQTKQ